MKYGLIDEDKVQREKNRFWKKELEGQILQLKWDCFNIVREMEKNALWRHKIEERIDLLSNAKNLSNPISAFNLNCSYENFDGGNGDQNRCNCSLNKTPVKDKESHSTFIFGSGEKTDKFEFKFTKEIPNVEFTMIKKTEKGNKFSDITSHPIKIKGNSCSKNAECKPKLDCKNEEVSKDTVNEGGDESKKNKHSNVESKASTSELTEKIKDNDAKEMEKKSRNKNEEWKEKICIEIEEVKNTILELNKQIKENSSWRINIEKQISYLACTPNSCETSKGSNCCEFGELKKLIYENYAKLQESVAEIKLSQMSRSELIFRLNDLKETVFDRIGGPEKSCKTDISKHENTFPFHDSLQELIVKWNRLEPLLDRLESNGHCKCNCNKTYSLAKPLSVREKNTHGENLSVSEANYCTDFELKSEGKECISNIKDNLKVSGVADVCTPFPEAFNEVKNEITNKEVNVIKKEMEINESNMSKQALHTAETSAEDAETSLQKSCIIRLFPNKNVFSPKEGKEEFELSNLETETLGNIQILQEQSSEQKSDSVASCAQDKTIETENTDEGKEKTTTVSRKSSLDDSSFVIV